MKKIDVLSIPVSTGPYADFVNAIAHEAAIGQSNYACLANVHMLVEAYQDHAFAQVVGNANIITPDGKPLSWAMRLLYGIHQDRVPGMTLLPDLLKKAEEENLSVFIYGGKQSTLDKAAQRLLQLFPRLNMVGLYSPPFRKLIEAEEQEAVDRINQSGAKIVFVILGCPKQEKWMAAMKGRINAYMVGVGGALPVLIGEQKRAPQWMQNAGLEWVYRLVQEPSRLFKRYAITNTVFIGLLLKAWMRKKIFPRLASTS